jgi:hypothetical protein
MDGYDFGVKLGSRERSGRDAELARWEWLQAFVERFESYVLNPAFAQLR